MTLRLFSTESGIGEENAYQIERKKGVSCEQQTSVHKAVL